MMVASYLTSKIMQTTALLHYSQRQAGTQKTNVPGAGLITCWGCPNVQSGQRQPKPASFFPCITSD